jgi:hypothetical protein
MTEPVLHILRTDDFVGRTEKTVQPGGLIRNGERHNAPGCTQEVKALLEELAWREREVRSPSVAGVHAPLTRAPSRR